MLATLDPKTANKRIAARKKKNIYINDRPIIVQLAARQFLLLKAFPELRYSDIIKNYCRCVVNAAISMKQ